MTIKITHHPFNYNYATIPISMAVAFIAVPACAASGNITASDIWLCIAAFIAPTAISSVLMHFPKATLSCNDEILDFNYLWVKIPLLSAISRRCGIHTAGKISGIHIWAELFSV